MYHIGINGVHNFVIVEKYTLPDTLINNVVRTSREVRLTVTTASKKKALKKLVAQTMLRMSMVGRQVVSTSLMILRFRMITILTPSEGEPDNKCGRYNISLNRNLNLNFSKLYIFFNLLTCIHIVKSPVLNDILCQNRISFHKDLKKIKALLTNSLQVV